MKQDRESSEEREATPGSQATYENPTIPYARERDDQLTKIMQMMQLQMTPKNRPD